MFRSSTILRELVQSLVKVIFLLKHSVKLFILIHIYSFLLFKKTHLSITDMLPHLRTIYKDVILLIVLTETKL